MDGRCGMDFTRKQRPEDELPEPYKTWYKSQKDLQNAFREEHRRQREHREEKQRERKSRWFEDFFFNAGPREFPVAILYETKNRKELDCMFDEIIVGLTKQEWYQLLKYVWDKKFNFLYLDTGNSFNKMYHRNFNTLELHTHMDELTDFGSPMFNIAKHFEGFSISKSPVEPNPFSKYFYEFANHQKCLRILNIIKSQTIMRNNNLTGFR